MKNIINSLGLEQLSKGHPWLYKKHLAKDVRLSSSPCLLPIGEHWFFCSEREEIPLKRLGPFERFWPAVNFEREMIVRLDEFKAKFYFPLKNLMQLSYKQKKLLTAQDSFRWIFAENDFIPSLVVDLYVTIDGQYHGVVQIQSVVSQWAYPVLEEIMSEILLENGAKKEKIFWHQKVEGKYSSSLRQEIREKDNKLDFENDKKTDSYKIIKWKDKLWAIDPGVGQKTGAYLDQKENHLKVAHYAKTLSLNKALDLCCFHGGHGLHLMDLGIDVTFVDQSKSCLEMVKKNLELNKISFKDEQLVCQDIFAYLREYNLEVSQNDHKRPNLIVLDPPSFAPKSSDKKGAIKGLAELNLQAIKALAPGGLLVSYVCSHSISAEDLRSMFQRLSHNTRRELVVLEITGPSLDHCSLVQFRESDYLIGFFLLVK